MGAKFRVTRSIDKKYMRDYTYTVALYNGLYFIALNTAAEKLINNLQYKAKWSGLK